MVSCEPAFTPLLMVGVMLVVPFGLPLLFLTLHGWRREGRASTALAALLAFAAVVFLVMVVRDHPGDPAWLPLLFVPPALVAPLALWRPSRAMRLALVGAAMLSLVLSLAWGVAEALGRAPCGA